MRTPGESGNGEFNTDPELALSMKQADRWKDVFNTLGEKQVIGLTGTCCRATAGLEYTVKRRDFAGHRTAVETTNTSRIANVGQRSRYPTGSFRGDAGDK